MSLCDCVSSPRAATCGDSVERTRTAGSADRRSVAQPAAQPPLEVALSSLGTSYERLRLVRPREYALMRDSVQRYGQISPAVAAAVSDGAVDYELVDGFKRYRACMGLGIATMKIQLFLGFTMLGSWR